MVGQLAQHRHHGGDAAARGEEQQPFRERVRQDESARRPGEAHNRPRTRPPNQVPGHAPVRIRLHRDRDAAIRPCGRRRHRVAAPVQHAVDVDAHPDVLAGAMRYPPVPGADDQRRGVAGLRPHGLDPAPEFAGRPQRVEQAQVAVRQSQRHFLPTRIGYWGIGVLGLRLRSRNSSLRFAEKSPITRADAAADKARTAGHVVPVRR